jgi:hypothetical protein
VAQRLRNETQLAFGARRNLSYSPPSRLGESGGNPPATQSSDDFRARAARLSGIQAELRDSLRRLGLPEDGPAVEQLTLLAVAPWCQILVESRRLSRLTIEEAEEIGRAVTASLLTTVTRKGIK